MASTARELDYSTPQPVGAPEPDFPFEHLGDFNTLVIVQRYKQTQAAFLADKLSGYYRPGGVAHPVYTTLLLQSTSKPTVTVTGLYEFTRTWATFPDTQYEPASLLFARPALHDLKVTVSAVDYYAVSFDADRTTHIFSSRIALSGSIGAITLATTGEAISANALPSATVTIGKTAGGTTTFSTGSDASTIQSALASALGSSIYVTRGNGNIECAGASLATTVKYADAGNVAGIDVSYESDGTTGRLLIRSTNQANTVSPNTPTNVRSLTTGSAHSGAAGGWLALWNGDRLIAIVKATAASGSSVTMPADEGPLSIGSIVVTHIAFATQAAYRIAGGPVDVSARRVRRFYLPGVSAGITNLADVPGVTIVTADPVSWLTAVIPQLTSASEDNYAVHATEDLRRWLDGPIYEKAALEIQLQDAVRTVAVGA